MKRRTFVGSTFALGAGLALPSCSAFEPSETLRFRITVEVDTPQGVSSGYSVWEYTVTDIKVGFRSLETDWRGEAVAVELPGGQTLFALLVSGDGLPEYPEQLIAERLHQTLEYDADLEHAFLTVFPRWRAEQEAWTVSPRTSGAKPRSGYPMVVTFRDIADPTSIELVQPDDLAASFGAGFQLRRISVKVTGEEVTAWIGHHLAWLENKNRKKFDPQNRPLGIPLGNYRGLFLKN